MSGAAPSLITFSEMPKRTYPEWGFRSGVPCYPLKMNFIFLNGGMGDYITWLTPMQWLADQATWIDGTLVVPIYLKELANYFLGSYTPRWQIKTYKEVTEIPKVDEMPFRGPVILQQESLNATGAHLMTCGWVYFCNKERAPAGWEHYRQFKQADLDQVELPAQAGSLQSGKYAVITTGITTNSRKTTAEQWNYIIEHVVGRGLTPVFLGKSLVETGNQKNIHTQFYDDVHYRLGVDLRNQTSLMQAAAIMSRAAVVIGHDNGLLHLAGCTEVPIVFGYNLASPEHREPIRPKGKTYNVVLTHAELACNFCQSQTNFLIGYNFRECFYKDLKCMDLLFANRAEKWRTQIDLAIEDREHLRR